MNRAVSMAGAVSALLVCGGLYVVRPGTARSGDPPAEATSAADLLRRFQEERIELHATVTLVATGEHADPLPPGAPVHGAVSWWAARGGVRSDAAFPAAFALEYTGSVGWSDAGGAWSGSASTRTLVVAPTATSPDRTALQMVNPLVLLVQHCRPVDDMTSSEVVLWPDVARFLPPPDEPTWERAAFEGLAAEAAHYPGSLLDGVEYVFRVTVPVGERDRPMRIEAVDSSGMVLTRTTFGYPAGDGWRWPDRVTWELLDGADASLVSLYFVIDHLALGVDALDPLDGFHPPEHAWPLVVTVEDDAHP